MKTNQLIGIVLLLGGLYLGYMGITKVSNNSAEVEVLGLEIDASNESGKETGYLYLAAAVLLFGGGVYSLGQKS